MEVQPHNHATQVPLMVQGKVEDDKEISSSVEHQPDAGPSRILLTATTDNNYDKPLSCFGCGIGWFSFVLGFAFPFLWYYATFLYLGNHYLKDPRERAGLAASAIAALIFSVALLIIILAVVFC